MIGVEGGRTAAKDAQKSASVLHGGYVTDNTSPWTKLGQHRTMGVDKLTNRYGGRGADCLKRPEDHQGCKVLAES